MLAAPEQTDEVLPATPYLSSYYLCNSILAFAATALQIPWRYFLPFYLAHTTYLELSIKIYMPSNSWFNGLTD